MIEIIEEVLEFFRSIAERITDFMNSCTYDEIIYRITFWFLGPGGSRLLAWTSLILGFYMFVRRRIYSYPALIGLYIFSTIIAYFPTLFEKLKSLLF